MRKNTFQQNLHRLADAHGLDFDSLAKSLGFIREDKKWLRRLWQSGLDQPNSRRTAQLDQLAQRLGLKNSRQLWEADVSVSVSAMQEGNLNEFVQMATRACQFFADLQRLHLRCPTEINDLLAHYGFDAHRMIAHFVASSYHVDLGAEVDADFVTFERLSETHESHSPQMERTQQVLENLQRHPAWASMIDRLTRQFYGKSIDHLMPDVLAEIERRLQAVIEQPPSMEEIVQRFTAKYLEQADDDGFSIVMQIISADPMWPEFMRSKGSEKKATQFVKRKWQDAKVNLIEPNVFASSFKQHHF